MSTYSLTTDDLRVLAFARDWSPEREGMQLELLRLRVMEVGVELIVIGATGVWVFGIDGRVAHVDRLAGNVAMSATTMYQARRGDAAFLIDDGTVIRVAYDGSLVDAITGAGELLAMRARIIDGAQDTTLPGGFPAAVELAAPQYAEVVT